MKGDKRPTLIAIANLKGGTGKTTIAAWLSCALACSGRQVVLIDLDPQAHLTSIWLDKRHMSLWVDPKLNIIKPNVWDYISGGESKGLLRRTWGFKNLKVVPSDIEEYVKCWNESRFPDSQKSSSFRREPALLDNDYVIFDCPPDPGYARLGVYASDFVIVPTDLTSISLRGTELFITRILLSAMGVNDYTRFLGVIVNRARRISKEAQKKFDEITSKLMDKLKEPERVRLKGRIHNPMLFDTKIPQSVKIGGIVTGKAQAILMAFKRGSEAANIFMELAKEVETRIRFFKGYP